MTSRQHQLWISAGKPDSGLALPLAQLRDELRAAGWLVYDWPNDAHLDAEPPEDHTFYSETGWPGASPKWWRHAIDIMPDGKGAAALTALGQRMFNDRQAGQITWLKYMNWPSDGNLGRAVQDAWEPSHARRGSSDAGHIHLSSITGVETISSPYNPLAPAGASQEGADMDQVQDSKLTALFDFKPKTGLNAGDKPDAFDVPMVQHVMALETSVSELKTMVGQLLARQSGGALPNGPVKVTGQLTFGG